jgi:hypothetical protein
MEARWLGRWPAARHKEGLPPSRFNRAGRCPRTRVLRGRAALRPAVKQTKGFAGCCSSERRRIFVETDAPSVPPQCSSRTCRNGSMGIWVAYAYYCEYYVPLVSFLRRRKRLFAHERGSDSSQCSPSVLALGPLLDHLKSIKLETNVSRVRSVHGYFLPISCAMAAH